jgi:hypothetical protein
MNDEYEDSPPPPIPSQKEVDAFVEATGNGDAAAVTAFLDEYAAFIDRRSLGETALTDAADEGRKEMVELLLARGAQIDAVNQEGDTPLMRAALRGHTDIVRLLLEKGADTGIEDNRHQTALMMARIWGGALEIAGLIEQWPELQRQRKEEERRRAKELADTAAQERAAAQLDKLKAMRPPRSPLKKKM